MSPGQSTEQPTLFEITELAGRAEAPSSAPETSSQSFGPDLTGSSAGEPRRMEAGPFQAVSPIANLPIHEVCGFCSAEVRAPGFVIPDYEELGVFCKQECGDRRFRLYLRETADEDSGLDDNLDQSST
jgi:hypothetical protein